MAENTKVTSEEVKEEKVETAKTSNTTKKKETKAPKKEKNENLSSRDRIDQVHVYGTLDFRFLCFYIVPVRIYNLFKLYICSFN